MDEELKSQLQGLGRLTDEERYVRETKQMRKDEERMEPLDKVLYRLERIEDRIRRMETFSKYQMKDVRGYAEQTFRLVVIVNVAVTVFGSIYLVNKELENSLFTWLVVAAIFGCIVFVASPAHRQKYGP
jgi:hypothetical protein